MTTELLTLEELTNKIIAIMDRDEKDDVQIQTIIPVNMIDDWTRTNTGWDIHTENGMNYSMTDQGNLYEAGKDA